MTAAVPRPERHRSHRYVFAYGHPSNPDALWVASDTGVFVRFTAGRGDDQDRELSDLGAAERRPDFALVGRHVGDDPASGLRHERAQRVRDDERRQSWTRVTGDLAALKQLDVFPAVNQGPGLLRAIAYVPSATTGDRIFVAAADNGVHGVFMMAVANPGVWTRVGTNLPNALAFDLDYDASRDQLVVGLVGRGAWTIPNATQLDRAPVSSCTNATVPADATCHATATRRPSTRARRIRTATRSRSRSRRPSPFFLGTTSR